MKHIITACVAGLVSLSPLRAQEVPIYLDESKPVEQRIDDALKRMTLDEKIAVIHAQSKFSSPGVKRLCFLPYPQRINIALCPVALTLALRLLSSKK